MTTEGRKRQGFAGMDPNKQREIASKGGKSIPDEKRTFSRDPALAAVAGRKGGLAVRASDRSFSKNPALAAESGRKGGLAKRGFGKKATDA